MPVEGDSATRSRLVGLRAGRDGEGTGFMGLQGNSGRPRPRYAHFLQCVLRVLQLGCIGRCGAKCGEFIGRQLRWAKQRTSSHAVDNGVNGRGNGFFGLY